ncbi:MAG: glycosyltransferase [Patescibacteria group bacterium]
MKLIALMRVKNEIDLIRESLSRLSELADEIIIVDNGSTDGTERVYGEFPKVIKILETVGFNEGRDKIMLLSEAKTRHPDWLIFLDADEIFEKNFTRSDLEKYMSLKYDRINFRLCHFWLGRRQCRWGKKYFLYSLQPLRCMWRNQPSVYFADKRIHNGDIQGDFKKVYFSPYRLKHFGLINRERILQKVNLYQSIDDSRNYDHLNPDRNVFTLPFIEFSNKFVNYLFILKLKYLEHFLWLLAVVYLKIFKPQK